MENKEIWIIGGSSGIGLATAKKAVDEGHTVYCSARTPCPDARIHSSIADVTKPNTITQAAEKIIDEVGRIDCLIYSAGFSMAAPVEHADEADYRYLYEVDFFGALHAVRIVLPYMRLAGQGKIVFVGSMGGTLPIAYDAFYSSAKAALAMLGRALNLELSGHGISVSTVLPGGTSTRFTYKRKVYSADQAGAYAADLDKAVGTLAGIEQGGMSPEAVADTVLRVALSPSSAIVAVGLKNKAAYLSQKILPEKLTQHLVSDTYNLT